MAERSKTGVFRSGSGSSCVKFMDIDLFALFEKCYPSFKCEKGLFVLEPSRATYSPETHLNQFRKHSARETLFF